MYFVGEIQICYYFIHAFLLLLFDVLKYSCATVVFIKYAGCVEDDRLPTKSFLSWHCKSCFEWNLTYILSQ